MAVISVANIPPCIDGGVLGEQVACAVGIPGNYTGSSSALRRHYMRFLLPIEEAELSRAGNMSHASLTVEVEQGKCRKHDPCWLKKEIGAELARAGVRQRCGAPLTSGRNGKSGVKASSACHLSGVCFLCGAGGASNGVSKGGDRWGGWAASVCDGCSRIARRQLRCGDGLNSRMGSEATAVCKVVAGVCKGSSFKGVRGLLREMFIKEVGGGRWNSRDGLERWKWKGASWIVGKIMKLGKRLFASPPFDVTSEISLPCKMSQSISPYV